MDFVIAFFFYFIFSIFGALLELFPFFSYLWLLFFAYLFVHRKILKRNVGHTFTIDIIGALLLLAVTFPLNYSFPILSYLFLMYFVSLESFSYTQEYAYKTHNTLTK